MVRNVLWKENPIQRDGGEIEKERESERERERERDMRIYIHLFSSVCPTFATLGNIKV